MELIKNIPEIQQVSKNILHHICIRLLNDQGFSNQEAKNILEVEAYLVSPKEVHYARNQVRLYGHSFKQVILQILKQKQRCYYLILLQQFWEARARKYKQNDMQVIQRTRV